MIEIEFSKRPPTVNQMYKNLGRRRATSERYTKWKKVAMWEAKGHGSIGTGKYGLIIQLNKAPNADYSNYIKPVEDMLVKAGITPDDKNNILPMCYHGDCKGVKVTVLNSSEAREMLKTIENAKLDIDK